MSLGMSLDSFERHVQPELRLIRRGKLDSSRSPSWSAGRTTMRNRCSTVRAGPSISGPHGHRDPRPSLSSLLIARRRPLHLQADLSGPGVRHPHRTPGVADLPHAQRREAVAAGRPGGAPPRHDAPPTPKTIAEAAEVLIRGAHDGTILDRAGKPYKPSTARGYEQLLRAYVVPALGGWKLHAAPAPRRPGLRRRPSQPGPLPLHDREHPRPAPGHLPPGDPPRRGRSRSDREPRPARDPRPPRSDRTARGGARAARGAPRHREGVLGRRAVLRPQTRRAPRPPVDQRRLRTA